MQFKIKSEMHYGEPDCPVPMTDDFPKDADLHFEIELIDFGKAKARFYFSRKMILLYIHYIHIWHLNFFGNDT